MADGNDDAEDGDDDDENGPPRSISIREIHDQARRMAREEEVCLACIPFFIES
jgi:hypothetical protein